MSTAYIGIGSNLGDRLKNCMGAIKLLEKKGIPVKKRSSIYETEPWGIKDQPLFLNMVIEIETDLKPAQLLEVLKNIEREVGRKKSCKWGPRSLDLDILLYDDFIVHEDNLNIPHPLMHERDFVLRPLYEIASDVKHPLLKVSVRKLFQQLFRKRDSSRGIS